MVKSVGKKHIYASGHNRTGHKQSEGERRKRAESLRRAFSDKTPEEIQEWKRSISKTKNSPDGKQRMRDAYQKSRDRIISSLRGRAPWNKTPADKLVRITCETCGKEEYVIPSKSKTRKYCSRECQHKGLTGRTMENWNPNSHHGKSGSGVSGLYRGVLFRSTYELAFIYWALNNGHAVVAEPIRIKLYDYLSIPWRDFDKLKPNQYYSPDYLVDAELMVEIKPQKMLDPEYENFTLIMAKMIALDTYCKQHNLKSDFVTEEDLTLLSDKQIRLIPKTDVQFFHKKHIEKYG